MSLLEKVQRCNRRDLARYIPFCADGRQLGWITPARAEVLLGFTTVFAPPARREGVTFVAGLDTPDSRSAAVAALVPRLPRALFAQPRDEIYSIRNAWSDPEAFRIDRALVPAIGARAFGVHLNGYVRRGGDVLLWIGTRALDLRVEPGKRDNMVAGGQPAGLTLMDNLVKECGEEAGLGEAVARQAVPAGAISYAFDAPEGLRMDTLFCYDLAMPDDLIPQPSAEISRFDLMPVADALALIRDTDSFKFNVGLVIVDFALRHGLIDPDSTRDFDAIAAGLRERPQPIV